MAAKVEAADKGKMGRKGFGWWHQEERLWRKGIWAVEVGVQEKGMGREAEKWWGWGVGIVQGGKRVGGGAAGVGDGWWRWW